jgi:hypothetical protein
VSDQEVSGSNFGLAIDTAAEPTKTVPLADGRWRERHCRRDSLSHNLGARHISGSDVADAEFILVNELLTQLDDLGVRNDGVNWPIIFKRESLDPFSQDYFLTREDTNSVKGHLVQQGGPQSVH